jgi:DNA-binding transcriptional LysR family regulator
MMRQDQLDGLVAFVAVAEEKGFSAAAVKLGLTPSAVSQSVRNLEQRLGVALFNRTTRSISLTEAGARYLERVKPCIYELTAATDELGGANDRPAGLLRLNVPRSGFMIAVQPVLRGFLHAYPEITIEVAIENALVDIVGRGFDAGIRYGDLLEQDMVAVKIGPPILANIVASPDYLSRRGTPKEPRDLLDHDCILFRHVSTGQIERWQFSDDGKDFELAVAGRLIVNDSAALVQAALDGIGVAYMINGYIDRFIEDGRLVRLLTEQSPVLPGLNLYYPDRRRVPPKLRAFIDYLRDDEAVSRPGIDGVLG